MRLTSFYLENVRSLRDTATLEFRPGFRALAFELESAVDAKDLSVVASLWAFIKKGHQRLKPGLTAQKRAILQAFRSTLRSSRLFVLSRGEIEQYLPE